MTTLEVIIIVGSTLLTVGIGSLIPSLIKKIKVALAPQPTDDGILNAFNLLAEAVHGMNENVKILVDKNEKVGHNINKLEDVTVKLTETITTALTGMYEEHERQNPTVLEDAKTRLGGY